MFNSSCSPGFPYAGNVCCKELHAELERVRPNSSYGLRVSIENQEEVEEYLVKFLDGRLPYFNPSAECDLAFRSFICLLHFGLIDQSRSHFVTRSSCLDVRDMLCARVWKEIDEFESMPVCENLPNNGTQECPGIQ